MGPSRRPRVFQRMEDEQKEHPGPARAMELIVGPAAHPAAHYSSTSIRKGSSAQQASHLEGHLDHIWVNSPVPLPGCQS